MCSLPTGHKLVADAVSMLRLRFGEPVRFKFLIGKNSTKIWSLHFLQNSAFLTFQQQVALSYS